MDSFYHAFQSKNDPTSYLLSGLNSAKTWGTHSNVVRKKPCRQAYWMRRSCKWGNIFPLGRSKEYRSRIGLRELTRSLSFQNKAPNRRPIIPHLILVMATPPTMSPKNPPNLNKRLNRFYKTMPPVAKSSRETPLVWPTNLSTNESETSRRFRTLRYKPWLSPPSQSSRRQLFKRWKGSLRLTR